MRTSFSRSIFLTGLFSIGLLAAAVAVSNVYFGTPPLSQIIVGGVGLALAFACCVALQDSTAARRITAGLLLIFGLLMVSPIIWRLFLGEIPQPLAIGTAILGGLLAFTAWRMLPR